MAITIHFMPSATVGNYVFNDPEGAIASALVWALMFNCDDEAIKAFYDENPEAKVTVACMAPGSISPEQHYAMAVIDQEGAPCNDVIVGFVCPSAEEVYRFYTTDREEGEEVTVSGYAGIVIDEINRQLDLLSIPVGTSAKVGFQVFEFADPSDKDTKEDVIFLIIKDALESVKTFMGLQAGTEIQVSAEDVDDDIENIDGTPQA